ncbi:MAG TPA: helix-turn-helix transcriptional regulator [Armatimonadota bacterium]|nr:helix-turn-helix transcriptional regulator [Armatimonadota bacterium]
MQNRFFSDAMINVLARSDAWTFVTSWFPADIAPVNDTRHAAWMAQHTHEHQHVEIVVTLCGGGLQGVDGRIYHRRPGSIFIFDSLTKHDYYFPAWTPSEEQLWISILDTHVVYSMISTQGEKDELRTIWRRDLNSEDFGGLNLRLPAEQTAAPAARLLCIGCMGGLLGAIVHAGYQANDTDSPDQFQQRIVHSVQQHICRRAGKGVTLESMAHFAGYSKYHFHRLFKQYAGMTVHEYIDQCREEKIRELRSAGASQKAIADALGFSGIPAYLHWVRRLRQRRHE